MDEKLMNIKNIKEYLRRNPNLLSAIKDIMDYRNLRTEQAYYAKLAYEYDHQFKLSKVSKIVRNAGEFDRSFWKDRLIELDKRRRATHNKSLTGFSRLIKTGRLYGYPKIYSGKILEADQIENYQELETRAQMTDAMFDMLYTIENAIFEQEAIKDGTQEAKTVKEMQEEMQKFNREYDVITSMRKDEDKHEEGGIEFDLKTIYDNLFENGNQTL